MWVPALFAWLGSAMKRHRPLDGPSVRPPRVRQPRVVVSAPIAKQASDAVRSVTFSPLAERVLVIVRPTYSDPSLRCAMHCTTSGDELWSVNVEPTAAAPKPRLQCHVHAPSFVVLGASSGDPLAACLEVRSATSGAVLPVLGPPLGAGPATSDSVRHDDGAGASWWAEVVLSRRVRGLLVVRLVPAIGATGAPTAVVSTVWQVPLDLEGLPPCDWYCAAPFAADSRWATVCASRKGAVVCARGSTNYGTDVAATLQRLESPDYVVRHIVAAVSPSPRIVRLLRGPCAEAATHSTVLRFDADFGIEAAIQVFVGHSMTILGCDAACMTFVGLCNRSWRAAFLQTVRVDGASDCRVGYARTRRGVGVPLPGTDREEDDVKLSQMVEVLGAGADVLGLLHPNDVVLRPLGSHHAGLRLQLPGATEVVGPPNLRCVAVRTPAELHVVRLHAAADALGDAIGAECLPADVLEAVAVFAGPWDAPLNKPSRAQPDPGADTD